MRKNASQTQFCLNGFFVTLLTVVTEPLSTSPQPLGFPAPAKEKTLNQLLEEMKDRGEVTPILPMLDVTVKLNTSQKPKVEYQWHFPTVDMDSPGLVAIRFIDNQQVTIISGTSTKKLKNKGLVLLDPKEYSTGFIFIDFESPEVKIPSYLDRNILAELLKLAQKEKATVYFGQIQPITVRTLFIPPAPQSERNQPHSSTISNRPNPSRDGSFIGPYLV